MIVSRKSLRSLKVVGTQQSLLFQGLAFYLLFAFLLQTDFPPAPVVPTANFTSPEAPHLSQPSTLQLMNIPPLGGSRRRLFSFFLLLLQKRRQVRHCHVDSTDSPPTADLWWDGRPYRGCGATRCRMTVIEFIIFFTTLRKFWLHMLGKSIFYFI